MNGPIALQELLEDFKSIQDPNERADMLIYYADEFQSVPESIATSPYPETNKVPGCESQAYVFAEEKTDGGLRFYYAVENPQGISAKAMAAILTEVTSDASLQEIAEINPEIIYEFFGKNVAMQRGLGLTNMVAMTRSIAKQKLSS